MKVPDAFNEEQIALFSKYDVPRLSREA